MLIEPHACGTDSSDFPGTYTRCAPHEGHEYMYAHIPSGVQIYHIYASNQLHNPSTSVLLARTNAYSKSAENCRLLAAVAALTTLPATLLRPPAGCDKPERPCMFKPSIHKLETSRVISSSGWIMDPPKVTSLALLQQQSWLEQPDKSLFSNLFHFQAHLARLK